MDVGRADRHDEGRRKPSLRGEASPAQEEHHAHREYAQQRGQTPHPGIRSGDLHPRVQQQRIQGRTRVDLAHDATHAIERLHADRDSDDLVDVEGFVEREHSQERRKDQDGDENGTHSPAARP